MQNFPLIAGRELRRRLPMAGQLGAQLLHPRRLLLHSTPTQHTDVVLIFPKGKRLCLYDKSSSLSIVL